jgi:hypothetical protein
MHRRERHFAFLNDNRVVHPFGWGVEFIDKKANGVDPREFFREYTKKVLANSDEFFFSPEITITNYELTNDELTWTSAIETTSPENNTAYAKFFRTKKTKNRRSSFCRTGTRKPELISICARFSTASAFPLCA